MHSKYKLFNSLSLSPPILIFSITLSLFPFFLYFFSLISFFFSSPMLATVEQVERERDSWSGIYRKWDVEKLEMEYLKKHRWVKKGAMNL